MLVIVSFESKKNIDHGLVNRFLCLWTTAYINSRFLVRYFAIFRCKQKLSDIFVNPILLAFQWRFIYHFTLSRSLFFKDFHNRVDAADVLTRNTFLDVHLSSPLRDFLLRQASADDWSVGQTKHATCCC